MKTLNQLRARIIDQAYHLGYSHCASALSALPVIVDIYKDMNLAQDVFILSKGHGSYALYAVLEEYGYFPDWSCHEPQRDPANGVMCTTGSLGHGLPVAAGIAFAKQLKNEPGIVHVLLGDGECAEGTGYESLLFIGKFIDYGRLKIHIDYNQYQAISKTIYPKAIEILSCMDNVEVIIHNYIKGYGIKLFEEHPECHVHPIIKNEYDICMKELNDNL